MSFGVTPEQREKIATELGIAPQLYQGIRNLSPNEIREFNNAFREGLRRRTPTDLSIETAGKAFPDYRNERVKEIPGRRFTEIGIGHMYGSYIEDTEDNVAILNMGLGRSTGGTGEHEDIIAEDNTRISFCAIEQTGEQPMGENTTEAVSRALDTYWLYLQALHAVGL